MKKYLSVYISIIAWFYKEKFDLKSLIKSKFNLSTQDIKKC